MRITLTKKIIAPFALIGILVLTMVAIMFVFDARREAVTTQERTLLATLNSAREIADHVKSGILTRQDGFAIEAARSALAADERLVQLGPLGERLRAPLRDYFAGVVAISSVYLENRSDEGARRLDQLREQSRAIDNLVSAQLAEVEADRARISSLARSFQIVVVIAAVIALLLMYWMVTRTVIAPITDMRKLIRGIADGEGDLTARLQVGTHDEIRDIADAFNTMMGKLQTIMRFVRDASQQVAGSAESLATAMSQTAQATMRQSESAAATSAAVEEVTVSITQVADHTTEAESLAVDANTLARQGQKSAETATRQIQATADAVGRAAQHVDALSQRSEQIRSIVAVIREIADQTNLLALNAAIEAARAGEQGRGFAVVADEVRKLAERTTVATKEIAEMIDAIGTDVGNAVTVIRESNARETEEVASADALRDLLARIGDAVARTTERVRDIASAAREQALAAESMAQNVESIASMSEEISAATGGGSESADSMHELASRLHEQVARFRV
ncbi:methyl-accepting chemotaxis protein [Aromatoleum toluclasticum]|uniref:methyl-accepting chemotaxis protein n=1 Tax=Aromatoleum toluclasticum TaxID=92003 RepID=UPI00035FA750|nr:methyl-accepting chemotaxis protein [Aromatoleum toluclasticum]